MSDQISLTQRLASLPDEWKQDWAAASVTEPPKLEVEAWYDPKQEVIWIRTDLVGRITHEVLDLKDDAVRQALIAAGWTPPEGEG